MPKRIVVFLPLFLLCLCIAALLLTPLPVQRVGGPRSGSYVQPGSGAPGAHPPSRGTCANVSQDMGAPFRGWPVNFYQGDWRTISAWYCDPDYIVQFGVNHWGIDISALVDVVVSDEGLISTYTSIHGAEAVATVLPGAYGLVVSARESGWNGGMGNHVKVMALDCREECGVVPGNPQPGEHFFVLEENSEDCLKDSFSTPIPGTPYPPQAYQDRLLACTETGWVATYMHLETVRVAPDSLVERGDVLGTVDTTGNSTGDHLHYQINGPGVGAVDPAPTMCGGYSPDLRTMKRWERPTCGAMP